MRLGFVVILLVLGGCGEGEAAKLERQYTATPTGDFMERCRIARQLYRLYSNSDQIAKANGVHSRSWFECHQTNRANGIAG